MLVGIKVFIVSSNVEFLAYFLIFYVLHILIIFRVLLFLKYGDKITQLSAFQTKLPGQPVFNIHPIKSVETVLSDDVSIIILEQAQVANS